MNWCAGRYEVFHLKADPPTVTVEAVAFQD